MGDTNYFSGMVKILEKPLQNFNNDKLTKAIFHVEIYQTRQNRIAEVVFWGNLANETTNYYKINDYLLIEGYTSIKIKELVKENRKVATLTITVLKVYPFLLNSKKSTSN